MALMRERSTFAVFAGREAAASVPASSSLRVINCMISLSWCGRRSIEAWIDNFAGGFDSENRERRVGEESDWFEHGGLVPVDVLMRQFAVPKSHDGHQWYLDMTMRGRDTGQHPGHLLGVCERKNQFIDELVLADGARDGRQCRVGRHVRDKTLRIEFAQRGFPESSGQHGYVIDIRVVDHGGQSGLGVARHEFMARVFLPE